MVEIGTIFIVWHHQMQSLAAGELFIKWDQSPLVNETVTVFMHLVCMTNSLALLIGLLLKAGAAMIAVNEIRGLILAGPVLYSVYESGGTLMAIWIGICSLGGIALSVIVPLFAAAKIRKYADARLGKAQAHA